MDFENLKKVRKFKEISDANNICHTLQACAEIKHVASAAVYTAKRKPCTL